MTIKKVRDRVSRISMLFEGYSGYSVRAANKGRRWHMGRGAPLEEVRIQKKSLKRRRKATERDHLRF